MKVETLLKVLRAVEWVIYTLAAVLVLAVVFWGGLV